MCCVLMFASGCQKAALFVTTDWLEEHRTDANLIIVDANAKTAYAAAHIPGAINLWYEDFNDTSLQRNLLSPEVIAQKLGESGIAGNEQIVIYGEAPFYIGRISWQLLYMGCKDVHILDGGLTKWKKEARETTTEVPVVQAKTFAIAIDDSIYATTDEVKEAQQDQNSILVDVRTDEEYNGWQLSQEPRGGHITGAVHVPITDWFNADKTIKSAQELTDMFAAAGVTKDKNAIFYCTIGGRSGLGPVLARHYLGFTESSNYDGSIREWGLDATLPMDPGFKNYTLLYPVKYVNKLFTDKTPVTIIDCRSEDDYKAGHIPGAINLAWGELSQADMPKNLLSDTAVAQILGEHGISGDDSEKVLIYTNVEGSWGADGRLFWTLEYMGHKDVHILNGGWKAWVDSGSTVETTINTPEPTTYVGAVNSAVLATKDYVHSNLSNSAVKIVDSRTDDEWNGAVKYGEARAEEFPVPFTIIMTHILTRLDTEGSQSAAGSPIRSLALHRIQRQYFTARRVSARALVISLCGCSAMSISATMTAHGLSGQLIQRCLLNR